MAVRLGELRRLQTNFAFTVQMHERAKPLEVMCDSEEVARVRIRALRAADRAHRAALRCYGPLAKGKMPEARA